MIVAHASITSPQYLANHFSGAQEDIHRSLQVVPKENVSKLKSIRFRLDAGDALSLAFFEI
ncbi:MAG: hypothetical protein P4L53_22160 [Candidatus Obscuribacterales bacterium]|nr:hypothetical protein [Candidatus Obscuribacterales bacterium]